MERELLGDQAVDSTMIYTYNTYTHTHIRTDTPIQGFFGKQWILTQNYGKSQMEEIVDSGSMKLNIKWENFKLTNIKWGFHCVYVHMRICLCIYKYSLLCHHSSAGSETKHWT
jgi:hypothetical protein